MLFDIVNGGSHRNVYEKCKRCPLYNPSNMSYKVDGRGNRKNPRLVIVGESLGKNEDALGKVFVGKCGKLQSYVLRLLGFDEYKDVFITNVIRCYPGENKKITKNVLTRCLSFLWKELMPIKYKYMILYGNWACLGILQQPISLMHEQIYHDGVHYIGALYHPSYYMRVGKEEKFVNDFTKLVTRMSNHEVDKYAIGKDVSKLTHVSLTPSKLYNMKFKSNFIAYDIEATTSDFFNVKGCYITCNAFSDRDYVAFTCSKWDDTTLKAVSKIVNNNKIVVQHSKFDMEFLQYKYNIPCRGFYADTELMAYIVNPTRGMYNLSSLVFEYAPEFIGYDYGIKGKGSVKVGGGTLEHYNAGDAIVTRIIAKRLYSLIRKYNMQFLFHELVMPLEKIFHKMELRGVVFDLKYLERLEKISNYKLAIIQSKIRSLDVWDSFVDRKGKYPNMASDVDVEYIFRELYGVEGIDSFNKYALTMLAKENNPLAPLLLEYRKWHKLKTTYVDGVRKKLKGTLLHSPYRQNASVTGRSAGGGSDEGRKSFTLQTIPPNIRGMIVPSEKCRSFISADYKTVEVRVAGGLSHEDVIYNACINGEDFHTTMASYIFKVPISKVTPKLRRASKSCTFGIIYGITARGLSRQIGCSEEEAENLIQEFLRGVPNLHRTMLYMEKVLRNTGMLITPIGRRRVFRSASPKDVREHWNMYIQSTAADITYLSMILLDKYIEENNLQKAVDISMENHDNIVVDVVDELLMPTKKVMVNIMENEVRKKYPVVDKVLWKIPLEVDIKIGKRYA